MIHAFVSVSLLLIAGGFFHLQNINGRQHLEYYLCGINTLNMTIDEFIKANADALKDKRACVIEHRGYRKQGSFGEQVMAEQRFDADGDPLKRVFIKKMVRGKYVIPYEYAEAGWVEYKPAPIKTIRKKIAESE